MGFGQFLSSPEVKLRIVTYRDAFQDAAKVESLFGEEYERLSATILLDAKDITKLSIKENDTLILKNKSGSIVVKAVESGYEQPHPGTAYMVNSPWSNVLVPEEAGGTGVPAFKDFEVVASNSKGAKVTGIKDIV
ncbi:molybdopterin dinucleotide binding domain-containing protein [Methanolobus halotolerans]|uniref:Formylmethanofuran dehydrogenase n=1 Tax=Methanolobus halotolerans TaxID=2052935 RepID=A0A4E0QZY7_9EURY|nr:molybdopterin dinucleotide binding domain-containing protein [Methanolobus halotolerans]TGC09489.1 formylmethanofuran dehydrogenase [Methanolobus halotolerans]